MSEVVYPGEAWQRKGPEEMGFDPAELEAARSWLDENVADKRYSVAVVRNGYLLADWHHGVNPDDRQGMASAAKSYFSSMLGIAVAEGKIKSPDEKVVDYYPEMMDVPEGAGPKEGRYAFQKDREITFRQLISNTSGYMKPDEEPGKAFHYQTFGMNICCHAIATAYGCYDSKDPQRLPGLGQLIEEKIRNPIGGSWKYSFGNFKLPPEARLNIFGNYSGISASTWDMLRTGWLWANWGKWQDRQVVPEAWLREATKVAPNIKANCDEADWKYGYGFWSNECGKLWPSLPKDSFAAAGAGAKLIWACPSLKMVVVQNPGLYGGMSIAKEEEGALRRIVQAVQR